MKLDDVLQSFLFIELMDCIDDGVLILDPKLRIIRANRRALLFFGYSDSEFTTKKLLNFIAEDCRKGLAEFIHETKERRVGQTVFLSRIHKRTLRRFSLTPLHNGTDDLQGYLIVSSLKQKENNFQIVGLSKILIERMLAGFADPLLVVDGSTRTVRDCNEATLSTFGFKREELIGFPLLSKTASEKERESNQALLARVDLAYATAGIFQERLLVPRVNGPAVPCDCTCLPFFRPNGSLESEVVLLVDRSSEEERESELLGLVNRGKALISEFTALTEGYSAKYEPKSLSALGFTTRQIEVVRLVALGVSSKEIGFRLGIAESTVRNHLETIFRKLGANSRLGFLHILAERHIRIS
jgi:DNA-binding CsgD family transcriptional regulator/PAS domain-containing protein